MGKETKAQNQDPTLEDCISNLGSLCASAERSTCSLWHTAIFSGVQTQAGVVWHWQTDGKALSPGWEGHWWIGHLEKYLHIDSLMISLKLGFFLHSPCLFKLGASDTHTRSPTSPRRGELRHGLPLCPPVHKQLLSSPKASHHLLFPPPTLFKRSI